MKKHRRLFALASALPLTLAALPCTALAADTEGAEPAQGAPPPAVLYPAEVRTSEENGMIRLEKVYVLSTRDDPAAIPTGDFDREGRHYTLLDVLKNDLSETDAKDYIEVVTLDSSTKDMAEIIKVLEPEREIATEDGYTGILKPDYTKITVEAAGYKNNSWTVSATRTYGEYYMKRVPFSIIKAAKESDAEAVDFIRRHFEGYIASQCLCHCTDEYGNIRSFVDDDLRYLAEAAMLSAIFKFRFREPPDDFMP